MKRYNIVMLVDAKGENVLMCRRVKPPYQGLYNLVGGKAEPEEDGLHAAYRELREETGVTAADTTLRLLATFSYPQGGAGLPAYELQAYVGRLRREVKIAGEENPLRWTPLAENFFDLDRYAGEGSIGHVVETVRRYYPEMLDLLEPSVSLSPLAEEELSVLAYYQSCPKEALLPMLADSAAKSHDGLYYEQFALRMDGCVVGLASLYAHEDGMVSDGIEVFPPFRRCGFAARALSLLMDFARERGYSTMMAQVRTDNIASLSLHRRLGLAAGEPWINRKGHEVVTFRKEL